MDAITKDRPTKPLRVGPGRQPFGARQLAELARSVRLDIKEELQPSAERPSLLAAFIGASFRQYVREQQSRPIELYLHTSAVNLFRASNIIIESIAGSDCWYHVFDQGEAGDLRTVMAAQVARLRQEATPGYAYYMLAWHSRALGSAEPSCQGITFVHCGNYVVGGGDVESPTHALYVVGAEIDFAKSAEPLRPLL